MKADVDRLEARNMVDEIEIQRSKRDVDRLLDSVDGLNFTIESLSEYTGKLKQLEARNDSLILKNDYLQYNNSILSGKRVAKRNEKEEVAIAPEVVVVPPTPKVKKETARPVSRNSRDRVKKRNPIVIDGSRVNGARIKDGEHILTNKASVIEKLKGCAAIANDPQSGRYKRTIYFQFLDPTMKIIPDNGKTISVEGNTYSKRVEFNYDGKPKEACNYITVPLGTLNEGVYTLNVYEGGRLISSETFSLK